MDIVDTTRNNSQSAELTSDVIEARKKIEENLQKLKRIIEGNEDCSTIKNFIEDIKTKTSISEISEELKQEISTQFKGIFNENDFIYILGYFFEHGLGFKKNEDIAQMLYKKAVDSEYPEAMVMVALKYKDLKEMEEKFQNAANKESVLALFNLHAISEYQKKETKSNNLVQAIERSKQNPNNQLPFVLDEIAATELLDLDAITRLAVYYENGLFVDKDLSIANTLHEFVRFNKNSKFTEETTNIEKARYFGTASEVIKPYISKNDIFKKIYITYLLKAVHHYEEEQKYEIAIRCYQRILELDSANEYIKTKLTNSYYELAEYYYKLAKSFEYTNQKFSFEYCKILQKYNKFLKNTKRTDILYMMANFYENGIEDFLPNNFEKAAKCYLQILEYNKNDSEDFLLYYSIAKCYEYQKKYQEAFQYCIQYIQKISSVEDEENIDMSEIEFCISFYNNHKELFELTEQKMLIAYCFSKMIESDEYLIFMTYEKLRKDFEQLLDTIPMEELSGEEKEKYDKYKEQISEQNSAATNDSDRDKELTDSDRDDDDESSEELSSDNESSEKDKASHFQALKEPDLKCLALVDSDGDEKKEEETPSSEEQQKTSHTELVDTNKGEISGSYSII